MVLDGMLSFFMLFLGDLTWLALICGGFCTVAATYFLQSRQPPTGCLDCFFAP